MITCVGSLLLVTTNLDPIKLTTSTHFNKNLALKSGKSLENFALEPTVAQLVYEKYHPADFFDVTCTRMYSNADVISSVRVLLSLLRNT